MDERNELMERVSRYLDGSMEPEEMHLFETELEYNEELRKELDFQSMLAYSLIMTEPIGVEESSSKKEEVQSPAKIVRLNKWAIYAVAASLIIAFAIIANIDFKPRKKEIVINGKDPSVDTSKPYVQQAKDIKNLAIAYFKREDIPSTPVGGIDEALEAYQAGDTREIIEIDLNQLAQLRDPTIDSIRIKAIGNFYKGIALYEKNLHTRSIRSFRQVVTFNQNDTLTYKANWYLGLNFVSMNDSANAIKYLTAVSRSPIKIYKTASIDLMKKIQQ